MATSKNRVSAKWTEANDLIFIEISLVEIRKGNRPGSSFSKEGWKNIVGTFNQRTGLKLDQKQLKNRWDQMKREWSLYKNLMFGETGIGWNSLTNTIEASDEWWDERIKVNSLYKKFRGKDLTIVAFKYDELFRGTVATGEGARAATQRSTVGQCSNNPETSSFPHFEADADPNAENSGDSDELLPERPAGLRKESLFPPSPFEDENSSGSKRKRSNASSIKEGLQSLINLVVSRSTETTALSTQPPGPIVEQCMTLLDGIHQIEIYIPFYYFSQSLFTKSGYRAIFMNQNDDRARVGWLSFKYEEYLRAANK